MRPSLALAGVTLLLLSACGPAQEVSQDCEQYCDFAAANCPDGDSIFETRNDCLSACDDYNDTGKEGDRTGDTLQCRLYHVEVANLSPARHCPHAAASGGGVCVQEKSPCNVYCAEMEDVCNGLEATRQYDSVDACQNACAGFKTNGGAGVLTGDTVQCRIAFLFQAPQDFTEVQACGAAGAMSTECVDQ